MKPRIAHRMLCMLLVLMLMPVQGALADDGAIITVEATEILFDSTTQVQLLSTSEGYYISTQEAGTLAGLPEISANGEFKNNYTRITVALKDIPIRRFEGEAYYALKEILDALEVYHLSEANDGKLYYNAVHKNIADFLTLSDELLGKNSNLERFSANLLGDNLMLDISSYGFAWLWDSITSLRYSALWGGALKDDISAILASLMQPFDGTDENMYKIAEANYKAIEIYCKTILHVQEQIEKLQETITLGDIKAGSDPFLFGLEGTGGLREIMETVVAINESNPIKFEDVLDISAQIVSISAASDVFVDATEHALDYNANSLRSHEPYELVIHTEAERLTDMYHAIQKENAPAQLSWLVESGMNKMIGNSIEAYLGELSFSSLAAFTATKLFFDSTINMSEKSTSVLTCKRLDAIQDLFSACYDTARDGCAVDSKQVLAAKGAAIMYLKCFWNAAEAFTFDESLAGILGGVQDIAQQEMLKLMGYIDGAFTVHESQEIEPGRLEIGSTELLDLTYEIGFFNDHELPLFDEVYTETVSFSYDLNCDGHDEDVVLMIADSCSDPYQIEIVVQDGLTGEVCVRGTQIYGGMRVLVIDMDTSDSRREIFISSQLGSDDGYISCYIGDCMDTSFDITIDDMEYCDINEGKLRLMTHPQFFTSTEGYHTYQYQKNDGSLIRLTPDETVELAQPLKSKRDIPVQWLTNGQYVDGTLPAESEITLTETDRESYALFTEDSTGRGGRFFCCADIYEVDGVTYANDWERIWHIGDYSEQELFYNVGYEG